MTRSLIGSARSRSPRPGGGLCRAALLALAILLACALATPAAGQEDAAAQRLADRHAPVMMLKAQEHPCDTKGEQYAPTSVDIVLGNPQIFLRQVGAANPVLMNGATASDVFGLGGGFYLDSPGDALAPGCIYEEDFRSYSAGRPPVVYAHVARQDDRPDRLALQYWFYWYFNDWNNKHEGDWEGIQLLFEVGTVEEALATEPVSVGYAQHEGGERAGWDDDKLERVGSHPVVYSSRGSHASYYRSALYLGRSASEGFGCDLTEGPSIALDPQVVVLPDAVDDPGDPLAWLAFRGRWGERQSGAFNGPTGPALKERWSAPIDWHDELRSSSVTVPGGDSTGADVVNAFCEAVGWGSSQLVVLKSDPLPLLVAVVVVFALASWLLARTDWSRVRPLPVARRRRGGQIMSAAGPLLRSRPAPFLAIALIYIPVALGVGLVVSLLQLVPFVDSLVDTDRGLGAVGVILTLVIGGLGHALAFVIVTAVVATLMRSLESGVEMKGIDACRQTFARTGDLLSALWRAVVIVGLLLISVVGIPWGVRQLVRYQFIASVVVMEGTGGRSALDRSTALARGRWFHTAAMVVVLNALVGAVAVAVGLVLLVLLTGVPLWLFSILVSASSAVFVCYSAVAFVLLYGDARAQFEELEPADRPGAVTPVRGVASSP